jgi:signal transduction histidine kinase
VTSGPRCCCRWTAAPGPFATLLVSRRHGRADLTEEELDLLRLFAAHVSVAVEFCRNQEELQRLATIEENERVGRELHDTVLQRLFAIGLHLQALSRDEQRRVDGPLQLVLDELDQTVREIRSTVLEADQP